MGRCDLNPLCLIRRDTDLSSIDWYDFIVDCLVRTKKVYNSKKESSFYYGPAAYLMYVDSFKFDHLQVTRKRPIIFYWTSEKIRFLEEECQESEYNEEESGGDEDEYDGDEDLCDEDEEEFDVNKVYENKISYMYQKMEDLKKDLVVKIDEGVLKFPQSQNLKNWKLLFPVEDLSTKSFDFHYVSQQNKEPILTPAFVQVNDDEKITEGDGSCPYEGNIGKNDVEGNGDVNDHAYEDDIGKNNDFLNEKDDEQQNGSGFNEEEAISLNFVVENVSTENLVDGCINQKQVEDDVNDNLTGFEKNEFDDGIVNLGEEDHKKEVISDHTVDKVIVEKKKEDELIHPSLLKGFAEVLVELSKAKKDGEGVVESEGVEVHSDLGKAIEDCSNKNKDGETAKEGLQIIQWKDSNETQSLKKDNAEVKVEKFSCPSFSLGFNQDSQGSNKASQSQSSTERMTKKKIKDKVYLGKNIWWAKVCCSSVDVIDASLVSFAPLLGTL
ncbi:unnamed protein product [Lactuca virosa]|uniref:Uncharacterized protein n=1 Tax=Lactuca virosa TaxID=75947 RepID=A0AAU9PQC3_9ASTR|nr:unnamed protein product [Lactuca virosa]